MPVPDPPAPEDERIFALLRRTGLDPDEAFILFTGIRDMASANLIARFESKLDALAASQQASAEALAASQQASAEALAASQQASAEALKASISALRWGLGLVVALLVLIAGGQLFGS